MPKMSGWLLTLLLLSGKAAAGPTPPDSPLDPPRRVVSINLCADVFLLHLAAPEQIASLTFLAASSPLSPVTEAARDIPVNRAEIEEVLALKPDLVVAHGYGNAALVANLKRLGLPVFMLAPPTSLAVVETEIQRLATVLGRQAAGQALLGRYQDNLRSLEREGLSSRPVLAVYGPNGITSGPGSLLHDVLTRTGFDNLAPRLGIGSVGTLRMESLLTHTPDALLFSDSGTHINSLARQKMQHPALRRLAQTRPSLRLPGKLWTCGGPEVFEAMDALRQLRASLP